MQSQQQTSFASCTDDKSPLPSAPSSSSLLAPREEPIKGSRKSRGSTKAQLRFDDALFFTSNCIDLIKAGGNCLLSAVGKKTSIDVPNFLESSMGTRREIAVH
jgi:hypothetical protein